MPGVSPTGPVSTERLLRIRAHPATWWLDAVSHEERRGRAASTFDLAERGLQKHPDDGAPKHRTALVLARTGSTEEEARRFDHAGQLLRLAGR